MPIDSRPRRWRSIASSVKRQVRLRAAADSSLPPSPAHSRSCPVRALSQRSAYTSSRPRNRLADQRDLLARRAPEPSWRVEPAPGLLGTEDRLACAARARAASAAARSRARSRSSSRESLVEPLLQVASGHGREWPSTVTSGPAGARAQTPSAPARSVPRRGEDCPERTVPVRQWPQVQAVLPARRGAAGAAGTRRQPGGPVDLGLVGRGVRRRARAGVRGVPSRKSPDRGARLRAASHLVQLRPRAARAAGRRSSATSPVPISTRSSARLPGGSPPPGSASIACAPSSRAVRWSSRTSSPVP